jgi:acyl carrier protein
MEVTLDKIREIFSSEVDAKVDVKSMNPSESMYDQGVDSLDSASVFLALEDEFGISFSSADIETLDTLNKIKEFIEEHKKEN